MDKYFENIKTLDEAKNKFRELSKALHPDKPGGDSKKFVEMKHQYGQLLSATKAHVESEFHKRPSTKLNNVLNQLKTELRDTGLHIGKRILQSNDVQNLLRDTASKSDSPYKKLLHNGIANFLDQFK